MSTAASPPRSPPLSSDESLLVSPVSDVETPERKAFVGSGHANDGTVSTSELLPCPSPLSAPSSSDEGERHSSSSDGHGRGRYGSEGEDARHPRPRLHPSLPRGSHDDPNQTVDTSYGWDNVKDLLEEDDPSDADARRAGVRGSWLLRSEGETSHGGRVVLRQRPSAVADAPTPASVRRRRERH